MKRLSERKGKRTRYNARHPKTGELKICVKVGIVYTFADGATVFSWNVKDLVKSTYITPETHKGGPD